MRWLLILHVVLALGCGDDGGDGAPVVDAAPRPDADPICQQLDSVGGVPDCSVCDDLGAGCDTISVNGSTSRVCDCTGSGCPCGLGCGDLEIAPGVVVGNICIR
jgi:hypothetical protein